MSPPNGSQQALSLAWALREIADFEPEEAAEAVCRMFGIPRDLWKARVTDPSWFVGDRRWNNREQIESTWNNQFARLTGRDLNDDAWLTPLWELWLMNPKMVLAANLAYLFESRGVGVKKQLAEATGKNPSTVSRWGTWKKKAAEGQIPAWSLVAKPPQGPALPSHPKVLEFFELKPSVDLLVTPLFLGASEAEEDVLRNRGKHYLDCLFGKHLEQAVIRLEEESVRQAAKKLGKGSV